MNRAEEQAQVVHDEEHRERAATQQQKRVVLADLATRLFVLFVLGSVVATLSTLAFLAVQDHHRIEQNNKIQQFIKNQAVENGRLSESIQSCTTPGEPCYQRSQEQTAKAVADINRVIVLSAACSTVVSTGPIEQRIADISACVTAGLVEP